MRLLPSLVIPLVLATVAARAGAQEEDPPATPVTPLRAEPVPITTLPPAPTTDLTPMPFGKPIKQGVALGYESGLWGSFLLQAVRLRIPVSTTWGFVVKGLLTHPTDHTGNVHPHFGGGRLDMFGGSPIIMGFARMYGGAGITVTTKVLGTGGNKDAHFGATGYFGFEFFVSRGVSFMAEIGGGSNVDGSAAGAMITAGVQVYLGS